MKKLNLVLHYASNVQILSALIWAFTIIACSWVADKSNLPAILISAAGFHVLLLAQVEKQRTKGKSN